MGRRLIYCLYIQDDIDSNKAYLLNKLCLKRYINIFDKATFVITVDDLFDREKIQKGINYVMDVADGREVEIKVKNNTPLCESKILKEEVLDNLKHLSDLIYFTHAKGVTTYTEDVGEDIQNSLGRWICGMYYFGLGFVNEMEEKLYGVRARPECFYGPFLCYNEDFETESKYLYEGTGYWINPMELDLRASRGEILIKPVNSRYYAENFPGNVCKRILWGDGLSSHKDIAIGGEYNLYSDNNEKWEMLSNELGEPQFMEFCNEIFKEANI